MWAKAMPNNNRPMWSARHDAERAVRRDRRLTYCWASPKLGGDCLENANPLDAEAKSGKEQRENSPTHAVVQIVDQAGLRCREHIAIT